MGRRRSANSFVVGMVDRARRRQSEGTLPFPFDPEGVDVMVLEAKARSNVMVRSPCCTGVGSRLQADRSSGFLSLTQASSGSVSERPLWVEKTQGERESEHLSRLEDEGNPAKRLSRVLRSPEGGSHREGDRNV